MEWISVEDRLPKTGKTILVYATRFEHDKTRMAFRTVHGFYDAYECGCGCLIDGVTHWQPLPPPPKEQDK